ncbi:hypothetical protein CRM22_001128 [Opisthorchis felineus]|uniref:Uncharacterized protein n=1 Tax=Opisthorchis felineus TaxID=147828 RepID=A0A4S2MI11_OPIFE|nr:hypothetical protein CRM22_001128 [Opisthorchis felineus]
MASTESARVKMRSRRFISELRKSATASSNASRPVEQRCDASRLSESCERSPNLVADIVEKMKAPPSVAMVGTSKAPMCARLSTFYRPTDSRHCDEFSRRRRRNTQIATMHPCQRKTDFKSADGTPTVSTPGRISRLAVQVESLELQDFVRPHPSVPTNMLPNSYTPFVPPIVSSRQSDKSTSPLGDSKQTPDPSVSPWYRHCRPSAPKPYCTPNYSRSDDSSTEPVLISASVSDQSSIEPKEVDDFVDVAKLTRPTNSRALISTTKLDLPALEMDVNQENRCVQVDFPLPPIPNPISSEPLSDDARWNDHPFPSPPSPLPTLITDGWHAATDTQLTTSTTTLGPLAPITNILPNPVISGSRHPKWMATPQTRNRMSGVQQTMLFSGELDSELRNSSLPSPPPVIIERLLVLPNRPATDALEDGESHNLSNHSSLLTNLARPTVLKRGPPDGAEQDTSSTMFELEAKKVEIQPTFMDDTKSLPSTDLGTCTYSPKKSRTHLLLPSEHSAFLPVGSNPALCRRVSSPCVH